MTYCFHDGSENSVEGRIDLTVSNRSVNVLASEIFILCSNDGADYVDMSQKLLMGIGVDGVFHFAGIT